tara:strand:- start:483 stop:1511 length:1029 start_codon:yes stop_codon:yes gene_type:complete
MKFNYLFLLTLIYSSAGLFAQGNFNVKGFGSVEHGVEYYDNVEELEFNWQLGEQSLFVTGDMGDKFSFLGEFSLGKGSHNHDIKANIHRVRIKYNYVGNHSLIIGQMHTPVNYWNDVYYHARIFFPTVDRPLAFSHFIPVHSIGIRAQGQNLGKLNFGYDIQTTNSLTGDGDNPAVLGAFHIKPTDGMRIGASYYYSYIADNSSPGSGMMSSMYAGSLDYQLVSFSFARFEKKLEILNEFTTALSRTDSLGMAQNYSNYLYIGYNIKELHTPYLLCDILKSSDNDLRNGAINKVKFGIGYKYQFTPLLNVKCQLERYTANPNWSNPAINHYEFTFQLSYAIY